MPLFLVAALGSLTKADLQERQEGVNFQAKVVNVPSREDAARAFSEAARALGAGRYAVLPVSAIDVVRVPADGGPTTVE